MRRQRRKKPGKSASDRSEQSFFPAVQKKLSVGKADDAFEKEADNVADKVVSKGEPGAAIQKMGAADEEVQEKPLSDSISSIQKKDMPAEEEPVQKQEKEEEAVQKQEEEEAVQQKGEEEEPLQKQEEEEESPAQMKEEEQEGRAKPQSGALKSHQLEEDLNSSGNGKRMESSTKAEMEGGFGADFGDVRLHTDAKAVAMNEKLGAQAFTHGNDIYFNEGKYDPESKSGKHLLAHELTHTIQQTGSIQKKESEERNLQSVRFIGHNRLEQALDGDRYVRHGSRGGYVQAVQLALLDIGYELPKYGSDGIFGSETAAAIREFQSEFSLKVDAIIGPETMGTMDDVFSAENDDEIVDFEESEDTDVLDGDHPQGPVFPTGDKSVNQLIAHNEGAVSGPEIQTKKVPSKVNPPSIDTVMIDLTNQKVKIKWSNKKVRGPYSMSSGRGCPNTAGDPCKNPKRSDQDTYCTPVGSFKAEFLGGKDYKSSAGDAMSWYMAFVSERGIGTHNAQPVTGTPRSHGCVRLVESVAGLIHNNVTTKSKISVFGKAPTAKWTLDAKKVSKSYKGCPKPKKKKKAKKK